MREWLSAVSPVFEAIEAGALVLTPNHRSAVQLLDAHGALRQQRRLPPVGPSPAVFPVDIWVRRSWETLREDGLIGDATLVMDALQERLVWQRVIRASDHGDALLNPTAAAHHLQQAYALMQQWGLTTQEIARHAAASAPGQPADETGVFLDWLHDYEARTERQELISLSRLVRQVLNALKAGQLIAPATFIRAGFTNPPPLYRQLLDTLAEGASEVSCFDFPAASPAIAKRRAADPRQEIRAAAHWARERRDADNDALIAVICPDLEARRREIERIFTGLFHPAKALHDDPGTAAGFSIGGSAALADCPLVDSALAILDLNRDTADTLAVGRLLRSPFVKETDGEAARAALERALRRRGELRVSLADLRHLMRQEEQPWHCPALAEGLQAMDDLRRRHRSPRPSRDWLPVIERQLALLGWPGPRPLNRDEHRQIRQWQTVLAALQQYGDLEGPVTLREVVDLLAQLARGQALPEAGGPARVKILTPTQAEGLQFTHLWFMGLSERHWPAPPRPNPFLPLPLQQEHGLPGSSADLQLQQGRHLLDRLVRSSQREAVLSYPRQDEESELKPCALLAAFGAEFIELPALPGADLHPAVTTTAGTGPVELLRDEPRVPLGVDERPGGGTALIAHQAACPFRSFALARLGAEELPALAYGLPPAAAGTMLHHALESLWRNLREQHNPLDGDPDVLRQTVRNAVDEAVRRTARRYPQTMGARFCEVEAARLTALLEDWLDEERKRGSFRIAHLEYPLQWRHAGLTLEFRIDRVEQLEDGSYGLVDYKSGKVGSIKWLDRRQDNPQLLLYLLAAEASEEIGEISSVLFAQVNVEDMKFKGIATREDVYPGQSLQRQVGRTGDGDPVMSWNELRALWRESLQALAEEFLAGHAAVAPKQRQSCQYCHLGSVCRVRESIADTPEGVAE